MEEQGYSLEMGVRDYECDMQGIVNNGVYQNYLEHARHEYLKEIGVDFAEHARNGINLVVVRAELDYKHPLQSGDKFLVTVKLERESKLKFAFHQQVLRLPERKVALNGKIIGTAINSTTGRPQLPESLVAVIDKRTTEG